jgi:hypothetical protein
MPTALVCVRCGHRGAWGVLSSQAWLEHRDGRDHAQHLCPTCAAALSEDARRRFLDTGDYDADPADAY